jgi:hypothetical protein
MSYALQSEDIKSFSSDPSILAFAEYFCSSGSEEVVWSHIVNAMSICLMLLPAGV